MQLRSFKAQGFKNFRQPVGLEDLGSINVIHGENNVGKSNLLQAIGLFFYLIGKQHTTGHPTGIPVQTVITISDKDLEASGLSRSEIFNVESPTPIRLAADILTTADDLVDAGLSPPILPVDRVHIEVELRWMGTHMAYTILHLQTADGRDFSVGNRTHEENMFLSAFATHMSHNVRSSGDAVVRYFCIPVERFSDSGLALDLYDTKEAVDIRLARRWDQFVDAMAEFKDILGEGRFVVTYDRKAEEASLLFQTERARIPVQLLGSGVQQLAVLLGLLLVSGVTIAGVEEPELSLRYTLQLRLREVLKKIVGGPGGLDQIFITSHSDAFEAGSHFYYMEATPDGPRIEKRPVNEARAAIGLTDNSELAHPNAALCYLSTEGVVRVPERIRYVLGLPKGGGVVFMQHNGAVEMMSDETFADRFEPKPEGEGDANS